MCERSHSECSSPTELPAECSPMSNPWEEQNIPTKARESTESWEISGVVLREFGVTDNRDRSSVPRDIEEVVWQHICLEWWVDWMSGQILDKPKDFLECGKLTGNNLSNRKTTANSDKMKRGQINLMEQRFFRNLSESGLWQTPESSVRQFSNYHLPRSLMPARKRERKEQNANSCRMPYYRMPSGEVSTEGETLSHGFKNLYRLVRGKFDTRNGKEATVREPGTRARDWESLRNGTTYTLYRMIQARLWESQNEYTHCFMHM